MHPRALAVAALVALAALPVAARAQREQPLRARPYAVDLVDESGSPLPTFEHRGRTYVLGALGERYQVRVRNGSGQRVEVVVSVDGRDAIDGRPSALSKRGYVVDPWSEAVVDGFRLSDASAAPSAPWSPCAPFSATSRTATRARALRSRLPGSNGTTS